MFAILLSASLALTAQAGLTVARPFADHMVLPMDRTVPIWGTATPGVEVEVIFGSHKADGRADAERHWRVELPQQKESAKGRVLEILSKHDRLALRDILVGAVWLCSGQSNMDFPLVKSVGGKQEAAQAGTFPAIHLMNLTGTHTTKLKYGEAELQRLTPDKFFSGTWEPASEKSALEFSAVTWWAGKAIYQTKGIPVGFIDNSVSGSMAAARSSRSPQ